MSIPESFISTLIDRTDVVEVVGRHVQLKKAGANFLGLCPFHGEKSPSFTVSPAKQFYHCFGCGVSGNAIKFLMEFSGMDFVDAIKELAQAAGMAVPDDERTPQERARDAQVQERRKTIYEVLEQAASAYVGFLKKTTSAQDYLKGRGLSGQIAKRFQLGWAPAGKPLAGVFADYADPLLEESGLVVAKEDGWRNDRFRERIMFPIRNVQGQCIGFGGRVVGQGEPKYLNSPETPVFSKGRELYGLFENRAEIQQQGFALVTEGYMDVVALAQHGIHNAVASLGTACTPEHVQKLFRFTEQIVFSFDGDKAGRKAGVRALTAVLPHASDTRMVKFLFLPAEHDPDSFVGEYGSDAFYRLVHAAMPLSRFLLESARENCDMTTAEGRSRFVSLLKPNWALLPEGALKTQLLGSIADMAGLGARELMELWGLVRAESAKPKYSKEYKKDSYSGSFDGEKGYKRLKNQPLSASALAKNAASRRKPNSLDDRAVQVLLTDMAVWDRLSASQAHTLCHLPEPHGAIFSWLEAQLLEHGALPWAQLRLSLPLHLAQAQEMVERLPDLAARQLQQATEPEKMLASDLQELQGIVLDMDLAACKERAKALALTATQQADDFVLYKQVSEEIRLLEAQKKLLMQQRLREERAS